MTEVLEKTASGEIEYKASEATGNPISCHYNPVMIGLKL